MIDLRGKTAIVTGGGSGIGEGVAAALARRGMNVVICGRRESALARVAGAIAAEGGAALPVVADVSQEADAARVVEAAVSAYGAIHLLINNAGISGGGLIHAHDVGEWDRIMAINLRGPFLMARAVLPLMRRQREGHIVNISSESGVEYYEGDGAYGVSKHALNALSEIMQRENQEYNVRVNAVCPGMVVTEMTEHSVGLNRERCLYPEDIADLVLWLVTRRANVKIGRPLLIQTMLNPWEAS